MNLTSDLGKLDDVHYATHYILRNMLKDLLGLDLEHSDVKKMIKCPLIPDVSASQAKVPELIAIKSDIVNGFVITLRSYLQYLIRDGYNRDIKIYDDIYDVAFIYALLNCRSEYFSENTRSLFLIPLFQYYIEDAYNKNCHDLQNSDVIRSKDYYVKESVRETNVYYSGSDFWKLSERENIDITKICIGTSFVKPDIRYISCDDNGKPMIGFDTKTREIIFLKENGEKAGIKVDNLVDFFKHSSP